MVKSPDKIEATSVFSCAISIRTQLRRGVATVLEHTCPEYVGVFHALDQDVWKNNKIWRAGVLQDRLGIWGEFNWAMSHQPHHYKTVINLVIQKRIIYCPFNGWSVCHRGRERKRMRGVPARSPSKNNLSKWLWGICGVLHWLTIMVVGCSTRGVS